MTTQNTPGDCSHPLLDIPISRAPTMVPLSGLSRSDADLLGCPQPTGTGCTQPGRRRAGPGRTSHTQRSIEVVRGAVPKQQPRERERGSSYSARRDNVDNAMPTVRTMTCTHITVVMVHMKDGQSHTHRLHGLRVVRTDTCPGRVECARRRTKCELWAKCAGQGDKRSCV